MVASKPVLTYEPLPIALLHVALPAGSYRRMMRAQWYPT